MDEKWPFGGMKQKNCDPADEADSLRGDVWDRVAPDPDSRLVLEAMVGPRTDDMTRLLPEGARDRLGGRVPELVAGDEYPAYREALLSVFGEELTPPRAGRPGTITTLLLGPKWLSRNWISARVRPRAC